MNMVAIETNVRLRQRTFVEKRDGGGGEENENVDFGLEISIFPPFLRHLNAGFSDKMNFNVEMGYVHASGNW